MLNYNKHIQYSFKKNNMNKMKEPTTPQPTGSCRVLGEHPGIRKVKVPTNAPEEARVSQPDLLLSGLCPAHFLTSTSCSEQTSVSLGVKVRLDPDPNAEAAAQSASVPVFSMLWCIRSRILWMLLKLGRSGGWLLQHSRIRL